MDDTAVIDGPDAPARQQPGWKRDLAPYAQANTRLAVIDVLTSVVPYLLLWPILVWSLDVSYLLTLAIAVPAAGFLLRTFIVFHDCGHGSFLASKRANAWLGRFTGLLVFTPYGSWRHSHAVHHATAGDLDRRGEGDVPTMTLAEYQAAGWPLRLGYRLFRNPLIMFTLGPIYSFLILGRIAKPSQRPRIRNSILLTNVAVVAMVGGMIWLLGLDAYLLVQVPIILMAGTAGVWLFFVQHQFEDVYWDSGESWSYADAALKGSSYLKLPKVLQFFSGNIGLHHVHHLSARVPNYNLQAAHDNTPIFADVPVLTMRPALRAYRYKLWDEDSRQLVGFAAARQPARARRAAASSATGAPATDSGTA